MVQFNPTSVTVGIVVSPSIVDTILVASIEPYTVKQMEPFTIWGQLTRADTEAGLGGMTVTLSGGTQSASTTTDSLGFYNFSGLTEAEADGYSYTISFAGATVAGLSLAASNAYAGISIAEPSILPILALVGFAALILAQKR